MLWHYGRFSLPPVMTDFPVASPIRVVLVEDDVHFQNALTDAIAKAPDMQLQAVAQTCAQGLQLLLHTPMDVLLVDLGLPDGSGIDVIQAAHRTRPACNIMVCTVFGDETHVMRSLEAGAVGYLLKDGAPHSLLAEIRSLRHGGSPISPLIARKILTRFVPAPTNKLRTVLSPREQEVLSFITKGFTAEEIAPLMGVTRHTVLTFVRRIYSKLEVNSKAEAIFEAHKQGLLGL